MANVLGKPEDLNASTIGDSTAAALRPAHALPESIGPYRIIECIGEGGMGIVYKAEQREPVRRVVALKIIKLGMDTKEVVARFDVERQALALMSHPNVAKVFDAGMTATGRPYFAMEHVPGVAITSYCDTNKLTTRERLELFIPVCQAVQHAHQKGIIHRDLKPGNILVTMFDGKPVPKVIDFGVAKATNFHLTEKTLFTQTGSIIGTVEYMSPEQATGGGLDIDTRTDIYSLGVILYQLLTGTLPFESETLRKVNMDEMARIIRDNDPPKPSARLTETRRAPSGNGPDADEIAKRHHTDPRTLRKELKGDLDWIVLKAMEKDRTRRYETASGLAMDLRRHLNDEPVLARSPSTIYRVVKFTRRHRVGVSAAAAIVVALLAGLTTSTIAFVRERAASAKAITMAAFADGQRVIAQQKEREAEHAKQTVESVNLFLQGILSDSISQIRKTPLQTLDDVASQLKGDVLRADPATEAHIRATLARNYAVLGLYQRAINQFRAALQSNERLHPVDSPELVTSLDELADALITNNDLAEAEAVLKRASSIEAQPGYSDAAGRAWTLDLRGSVLAGRGDWENASPLYQQALAIRQQVVSGDSPRLADSLAHQADILLRAGNSPDPNGQASFDKAVGMYKRVFEFQPLGLVGPLRRMARTAAERKDWNNWGALNEVLFGPGLAAQPQDLGLFAECINSITEQLIAKPKGRELRELLLERGACFGRRGDFEAALADYTTVLELDPKRPRIWHWCLPLYLQRRRFDKYRDGRRDALNRFKDLSDPQMLHPIAKSSLCFAIDGEDLKTAAKMAEDAVHNSPQFPPGTPLSLAPKDLHLLQNVNPFFLQSLGMAKYRLREFPEAIALFKMSRDHVYVYRDVMADFYIAMAAAELHDYGEAHSYLDEGNRLWQSVAPQPGKDDLEQFEDWILCDQARQEATSRVPTH